MDEFQGDVHAADIVGPTGEEMPLATHAEVHHTPEQREPEARPRAYGFNSRRGSD
jgi:hypothetical protein